MTEKIAAATERAMQTQACVTAAKRTEGLTTELAQLLFSSTTKMKEGITWILNCPINTKNWNWLKLLLNCQKFHLIVSQSSNSIYRTTKYLLFFRLFWVYFANSRKSGLFEDYISLSRRFRKKIQIPNWVHCSKKNKRKMRKFQILYHQKHRAY